MIKVATGDPYDPAALRLLEASHALMASLFPAEANNYLSVDALCGPDIRFKVAQDDGVIVGCAALALRDGYGEIKSMFVDEAARGSGVADALLAALEAEARAQGFRVIKLETGDSLHAAHKVYARHGFSICGPFGDYDDGPYNVFMEKQLEAAS